MDLDASGNRPTNLEPRPELRPLLPPSIPEQRSVTSSSLTIAWTLGSRHDDLVERMDVEFARVTMHRGRQRMGEWRPLRTLHWHDPEFSLRQADLQVRKDRRRRTTRRCVKLYAG